MISRGNDKQAIYLDDFDFGGFLVLLARVALKKRWCLLTYCLMTNHYHLILQIPHGGLSDGMRELNGGYSRQTNGRYGRSGHVLNNRFSAELIDSEAHLLNACGYVVCNPLRAGLCRRLEDWPWSSYRACAGLALAPSFLAVGELLGFFGRVPQDAQAAYRAFVSSGHVRCQTP